MNMKLVTHYEILYLVEDTPDEILEILGYDVIATVESASENIERINIRGIIKQKKEEIEEKIKEFEKNIVDGYVKYIEKNKCLYDMYGGTSFFRPILFTCESSFEKDNIEAINNLKKELQILENYETR